MMNKRMYYLAPFLKSLGQIMLQENAWTGLLFLIGIFYGSILMGVAAILAVLVSHVTATLLKYDRANTNSGLYGFNPALVGVALIFYLEPSLIIWVTIIAGAVITTMLQHLLIQKRIPGYTFPFILFTWICLYIFHQVYHVGASQAVNDALPIEDDFTTSAHGFGEVIFQGSAIGGVVFFLAVFINSPIAALYGLAASVLSASVSLHMSEPAANIHIGLFSFNAVLCAITFAGPKPRDGVFVLIAVILSVYIDIAMLKTGCTVLTFPFVAATWLVLLLKKGIGRLS